MALVIVIQSEELWQAILAACCMHHSLEIQLFTNLDGDKTIPQCIPLSSTLICSFGLN